MSRNGQSAPTMKRSNGRKNIDLHSPNQNQKTNKAMGTGFNLKPVERLMWAIFIGSAVLAFVLGGVTIWLIGLID